MQTTNLFYRKITEAELQDPTYQNKLITFLFQALEQYRDPETDIKSCLEYICDPLKGGHVFVAEAMNKDLKAVVFLADTHMGQFVPEYLLVYIATDPQERGKGLGRNLITYIQDYIKAPIALHVEHDNPAVNLYEKLGFTSKYKEMRWYPHG